MENKYDDDDNLVGDLILMIHPKLNIVQAVLHLHLATNKVIFYKILKISSPQKSNIFLPWASAA